MYCINDLMNLAVREAAEEIRLEAGQPPVMVLHGRARALDLPPLTEDNVMELFRSFASPEQIEELGRCGDVRFNHIFQHSAQFAVVAQMQHAHITLKLKNLGR
jgi:Tfp pilus assembly pilus retraction ATPase PilT